MPAAPNAPFNPRRRVARRVSSISRAKKPGKDGAWRPLPPALSPSEGICEAEQRRLRQGGGERGVCVWGGGDFPLAICTGEANRQKNNSLR